MIENKLVTIKKENIFDKGWALFTPCKDISFRNNAYNYVTIDKVVKKITYANKISLILSEPCLSHKVVEELKWVNKYAEINIIAKSQKVVDYYRDIYFNLIKIEPLLSLNYIGINGRDEKSCYFIENGFINTDDTIEKLYTATRSDNKDLSELKYAEKVIVFGESQLSYNKQIIDFCLENSIMVYLAKRTADFTKSDYDNYINTAVNLIVADNISDGICIEKGDKIFRLVLVEGQIIFIEIENLKGFISGDIYVNLKKQFVLAGDEIPCNGYLLLNGKLKLIEQSDCYIVEKEVPVATMKDFIEERFDRSETDNHNQFSSIAKCVEYRFTLIPPSYTEQFVYSALYNPFRDLYQKWQDSYILPIKDIKDELGIFQGKELFVTMLKHIEESNESVDFIINGYNYKCYIDIINRCKNDLIYDKENIVNYCLALYDVISAEITDLQSTKIDAEIAGYERTIQEKQADIDQSVDVLKNKHRIEMLTKKIEDLLKIKGNFSLKQTSTAIDNKAEFMSLCDKILDGTFPKAEENSVATIVNSKEISKEKQLSIFLKKWLKPIKTTLTKLADILSLIKDIDVPEDYVVYDYNGGRYIVIDEIAEYQKTMPLQEKYNLQCVARR